MKRYEIQVNGRFECDFKNLNLAVEEADNLANVNPANVVTVIDHQESREIYRTKGEKQSRQTSH